MVAGAPGWLLAAQAVGTYAPLAGFGQDGPLHGCPQHPSHEQL
jgi:hypothetical protein